MASILGIAVIGAGQNAQRNHLPTLKRLSEEGLCNLLVLCDRDAERAAKASESFGFASHTHKPEEVFANKSIDVVYVFGTVQMHSEYMRAALENGKHVFVEKPPAKDFAEASELAALSAKHKKIAAVGLNRRFYESINTAKKYLEGGGRAYSLEGVYDKPFLHETYIYGSSSWISYSCIHGIDALLYIAGRPPEKIYSAHNTLADTTPKNLSALFVWEDGTHAVLASNNTAGSRSESYTINGHGVSFMCDEASLTEYKEGGTQTTQFKDPLKARGFYGEHREFLEAIHGGKTPRHSIENALVLMKLIALLEQGHCGLVDWTAVSIPKTSSAPKEKLSTEKIGSILVLNPATLHTELPILSERFTIVSEEELDKISSSEKKKILSIIAGLSGSLITKKILNDLPSLKIVGIVGASVKKHSPEDIVARGIPIANTSDTYAKAVAEFNLMQAMIGIKKASASHDAMRAGKWGINHAPAHTRILQTLRKAIKQFLPAGLARFLKRAFVSSKSSTREASQNRLPASKNLEGIVVGIVGYGAIARAFIELLKNFNCRIKVYSEYLSSEEAKSLGVTKAYLADVLDAEVVSLHRGLSARTEKSFGENELSMLRSGTVFINASRGKIVDEEALIARLSKRDIFACLDVFSEEPLSAHSPLRKLPNVFLTSHIAGVTSDTFSDAPASIIEKVEDYLMGKPVSHLITSQEMLKNMS